MRSAAEVPSAALEEVVRRIGEVAKSERIILFGSAARGEAKPDSDLDLLVVADVEHRRETERRIYRSIFGVGVPVDVVVVTTEDVERYKDSPALAIRPALREGKVVYDASGAVSAG